MRCVVAAAVVCAACGHAGLHRPGVDPALANELVAWDGVRMHAEARLLAVPLPAITVREPAGATAAVAVTGTSPPRPAPIDDCPALRTALADFAPGSVATMRLLATNATGCGVRARGVLCRIAAVSDLIVRDPLCAPWLPRDPGAVREA